MRILVASDGSPYAREAALFASCIAKPASADIVLLGVVEQHHTEDDLRRVLEALREEIAQGSEIQCEIVIRHGDVTDQILAEVQEHFYHMVAIGVRGLSKRRRRLMGKTSIRLTQEITAPLLVVTLGRHMIRRVLICTSGEKPGEADAFVGGALAALVGAQVTVLHVMSQLPLAPKAPIDDLEHDAPDLIQSGTREGQHLQRLLSILASWGIDQEQLNAKVRHGLVVDEVIAEVREGDYDLVVIGAHQIPADQPWAKLRTVLQENIAEDILKHTRRPVLVVRALDERKWKISQPESASE